MGKLWRHLRVAGMGSQRLLALVLLMLFGFSSVAQALVQTAEGVQCPTASVQLVSVPVRDCCGKIVGYTKRAPKIGEATFMQCRCAEKSSAETQKNLDRYGLHVEMMIPVGVDIILPDRLPEAPAERALTLRLLAVPAVPPVPPPSD